MRYWINLSWQARGVEQFELEVAAQQSLLELAFDRLEMSLGPIADHWRTTGELERDDLRAFYALLSGESALTHLRGIGAVAAGGPASGAMVIAAIEPAGRNSSLAGIDIAGIPALAEAAATARATMQPQFADAGGALAGHGFFLVHPVAAPTIASGTAPDLVGWLIAPVDIERVFEAATLPSRNELGIAAYSATRTPLYTTDIDTGAKGAARFVETVDIVLFGQDWTLDFFSLPDLERLAQNPVQKFQLLGTGIVALLMAILVQGLADRVKVVRLLVKERTRDLSHRDREQKSILENALVGIFSINCQGEILYRNRHSFEIVRRNDGSSVATHIQELIPEIGPVLHEGAATISFEAIPVAGRTLRISGSRWTEIEENDRATIIVLDISDQVEALLSLEAVQQRLDAAMSSSEIGVFDVDLTTGKSVVSDSWMRMMGLSDIPEGFDVQAYFLSCLNKEDREKVADADRAVIEGRAKRSIAEYRITIPGRGQRWMRSDAALLEVGSDDAPRRFIGTQIDITDEKRAQALLLASEDRFRRIFRNAPTGNLLVNLDYQIIELNERMRRILGVSLRLTEKTHTLEQVFGPRWPDLQAELRALANGETARIRTEFKIERSGDTLAWLDVDVGLFEDPVTNHPIYFFQIVDTTRLHAADRAKDDFLATVSHELRTPITSIKGAAGLLVATSRERLSQAEIRLVEIIDKNADRVTELVSDILDMEGLRTGEVAIEVDANALDEILDETLVSLQPYAERFSATLLLENQQPGVQVTTNARRAVQCLTNLVSNACKYGQHGTPILVRSVPGEGRFARVEVVNQGAGIPEVFESKLFTAFSRADTSDTRANGGTGLGLKITKELMSRMGGDVTHHRDQDGRTVFTLSFPLAE